MDYETQPLTLDELRQYRLGSFATRESLDDALSYAIKLAKASDSPAAVLAAVHVVVNTIIAALTQAQSEQAKGE